MLEDALDLINENKRSRNTFLDLGKCGLNNEIPRQLFECTWLVNINFSPMVHNRNYDSWSESRNPYAANVFRGDEFHLLGRLPDLKQLSFSDCEMTNIDFLENLPNITHLDLAFNNIRNLQPIQHLTKLQYLNVGGNKINDISVIKNFSNLTSLLVFKNQLGHLLPLRSLRLLKRLNVSNNKITDLSMIEGLTNLEYFDSSHNKINNIRYLGKITRLKELYLEDNEIKHLGFEIGGLSCLEKLNVGENQVDYIGHLLQLTGLRDLDLRRNRINRFELDYIMYFPKLSRLGLEGNPITNLPANIVNQYNCLEDFKRHYNQLIVSGLHTPTTSILADPPEALLKLIQSVTGKNKK